MDLRFFEIYRNPEFLWLLAEGALVSALLTIAAAILGLTLAFALAGVRFARVPVLRQIAGSYVEFVRNTPLIVQMFFIAFGLPILFGYQWPFWGHALLALTINFSGYFAEILRAGMQGTDQGQREAARSLGLRPRQIFIFVVVPNTLAAMFTSLHSQFIFLFLTTGIVSEIGVRDLTYAGLFIDSRTFRTFEVFLTLTLIYILMSMAFKFALGKLERAAFPWKFVR